MFVNSKGSIHHGRNQRFWKGEGGSNFWLNGHALTKKRFSKRDTERELLRVTEIQRKQALKGVPKQNFLKARQHSRKTSKNFLVLC